ncbi:MAG TPA: OmpA family protein [Burkholderiaceae bacterium]|jgi:OOP family OmpA-OmpF porin|nr:OmpA family protein [Burkholderiaceae bacterium]
MIKTLARALAAAIAVSASVPALAQSTTDIMAKTPSSAYLQDSRGAIVRSGTGMCWRTGYWTPADAVLGCDGDLLPPVVNAIAPPIVAQTAPQSVPSAPIVRVATPCDLHFTLGSDETFSFNGASLNAAAKKRIDEQLRGANCSHIDKITVSGFTDHLGSDQLNQSLSLKRAAAVAEYLGQSGINAPIEQRGMGKQQELKACKGIKLLHKLIECLAPNRRVEIDVKGVR